MNTELNNEHRILVTLRQVLASVVREVTPEPGLPHPLSQKTMEDVRQCFLLIAAREKEISELLGKPSQHRPHYVDEPKQDKVVKLHGIGPNKTRSDDNAI
ncbi:MAG: hypothetical protein QG652_1039 [Pseudomonadota bacterium]|nr:hypothetical protein [Pseudomonadota bacterium]